ncbi:hypothetical protein [Nocardioides rubriscoriae]|uniref:hypothetical protein n=1 Tax=Nocardioides rubriscoriae TaxID=642762 RepID=UPI0011DF17B3|nr:hypothetical protein [Nocardioides rubriscoriae]
MIDFSELSLLEAQAYCDSYVASLPYRRLWLRNEIDATTNGRADMLSGVSTLPMLSSWSYDLIDKSRGQLSLATPQPVEDQQMGNRPPWYETQDGSLAAPLSDGTLWLIDLLGVHLADLVTAAVPTAEWGVYVAPKRSRDINQHQTGLLGVAGGWASPWSMVYGQVISRIHYKRPWHEEGLGRLYNSILDS